jgi:hypothetical protein
MLVEREGGERETHDESKKLALLIDGEGLDEFPEGLDEWVWSGEPVEDGDGSELADIDRFGRATDEKLNLFCVEEGERVSWLLEKKGLWVERWNEAIRDEKYAPSQTESHPRWNALNCRETESTSRNWTRRFT